LGQLDDCPIVTWATTPLCLPPVAHICRAAGHDQVMAMAEEHVATGEHECAVFGGSQIDGAGAFELVPVRHDLAVYAQSCDATVRVDLEAKVCDAFFVTNWKRVLTVATELHLRE